MNPENAASVSGDELPSRSAVHSAPWKWPGWLLARLVIALIRVYQYTLSPLFGRVCRFEPSCSRYMIGALEKYGLMRGLWLGTRRLLRCHPWHPGGYDPP
jgi:putative membrane protein insertion efficiency factor